MIFDSKWFPTLLMRWMYADFSLPRSLSMVMVPVASRKFRMPYRPSRMDSPSVPFFNASSRREAVS